MQLINPTKFKGQELNLVTFLLKTNTAGYYGNHKTEFLTINFLQFARQDAAQHKP